MKIVKIEMLGYDCVIQQHRFYKSEVVELNKDFISKVRVMCKDFIKESYGNSWRYSALEGHIREDMFKENGRIFLYTFEDYNNAYLYWTFI